MTVKTAMLLRFAVVGAGAVLTFGGCGSSSTDSTPTARSSSAAMGPTTGLSKAEFIARADAIGLAGTYGAEEPSAEALAMATIDRTLTSDHRLARRYGFKVCGTLG